MRILYLNHYAGSPMHGMEYRPYYLAREWVRAGDKINILAASYSHLRQQNPSMNSWFVEETLDGITYSWFATPKYEGNGVKRVINIFSWLFQVWRKCQILIKQWQPDVVIASSTYPLDIYLAHRIAKQSGAQLIFEVHDLWPLTPVEVGGMSPGHPFVRLLQHAEDYAYRHADVVVSMLPCAKAHMMAHGMAAEKFQYIPNGIVVDEWEGASDCVPARHAECLASLKQQGRFILLYAGGHGLANALDDLLQAAGLVRQLPVSFVLVGDGPDKAALEAGAREMGLAHVHFLPPVAKAAIPALLAQADALYIGWRKLPIYRFGINPNKLFDYMMAGKPVLHAVDAGNDIVTTAEAGISVPAEQPQAIADGIAQLLSMCAEQRQRAGENGRRYVLAQHDYRVLAKHFRSLFRHRQAS